MNLKDKLKAHLNGIAAQMDKQASDESLLAEAEQTPQPKSAESPEAAQSGEVSAVATNSNGSGEKTQPGTESEVGEALASEEGGVDAAIVESNSNGEAAAKLGVEKEEVTKEDIATVNKAANAIRMIGQRISQIPTDQIASAFEKRASAMDATDLLVKMANDGDRTAQHLVDFMASYELGMQKKASDLEEAAAEAGAQSPEDVAAIEAALNEAAVENPDVLAAEATGEDLGDEEYEDEEDYEDYGDDDDAEISEEELGAALEEEAQAATEEVAEALMEENPEADPEEVYQVAQAAVVDAIQMVDAQQAIGATDEDGEYLMDDDAALGVVDQMGKTASANGLRDTLVPWMSERLGFSQDAYAQRLFGSEE